MRTSLRSQTSLALFFVLFLFSGASSAQTAVTVPPPSSTALLPGPKPPDASPEWKRFVGIYRHDSNTVVILESQGKLFWQPATADGLPLDNPSEIRVQSDSTQMLFLPRSGLSDLPLTFRPAVNAESATLIVGEATFVRSDAGSDPAHFYHITLSKPLAQLRAAALTAKPPSEHGPFRKPDLVELTTLDPSIHLDIRYAQSNNFLSTPVYTQARAFLQRPAAEALLRVLHKLQSLGYGLLIHDAYRPWYVTKIFWDATPAEGKIFVADPLKGSRHNRGCAVDLTLYDLSTGQAIEMPGLYDEMSPRSFPNFPGGTSLQRWHRDLLRGAMESEGFTVNEDEWWHFDYKEWRHYPILNVPFEELSPAPRPAAS